MASSPDRGRDPQDSRSKSENPFIRFRQFADAHISSFLQGVIGLPSAFSRNPNARWTDLDDDLRRRDELQAKQKKLYDAESRRMERQAEDDEVDIPVKKSARWGKSASDKALPTGVEETVADGERDLPLYSPVTKSLFSHLPQATDPTSDWGEVRHPLASIFEDNGMQQGQQSSDVMKTLHYMAYNELKHSPVFRSSYSLLPYLLFSAYSPLKLSANTQIFSPRHNPRQPLDEFPYCEAFEDLILTSQGRPMMEPLLRIFSSEPYQAFFGPVNVAANHMSWIGKLLALRALQQSEGQTVRQAPHTYTWTFPSKVAEPQGNEDSQEASTEQDMYDRFLQWASSPSAVAGTLDSLFSDTSKFIEHRLEKLQDLDGYRKEGYLEQKVQEIKKADEKSPGIKVDVRINDKKELSDLNNKSVSEADRVVSTSTTTVRKTKEDGSVETNIKVWKRLGDGRESTTTTTHCEAPALNSEDSQQDKDEPQGKMRGTDEKKSEKKGWFWN